jgi:hypothetical protein
MKSWPGRSAILPTPLAARISSALARNLGYAFLHCTIWASVLFSQTYKANLPLDHPAIRYFQGPLNDRVTRLAEQAERGRIKLESSNDATGYLPSLLKHLDINADSQMLVFSKTSFQATRIAPDNPRAIYFNDDVAVGYVRGSDSLEVAILDPMVGTVFYSVRFDPSGKPSFTRNEACLKCHQGPNTFGIPGFYVGSVIPGPSGAPLRNDTAIVTDHRTEFKNRWGGWYVNAKRGEQEDRANAVAMNPSDPDTLVRESQQNLPNLIGRFRPSGYLNPISDIVALMTFEHQTQMANLITRVGWDSRTGEQPDIEELVSYMLFAQEAPLKEPVEGVSTFTSTFPKQGPRDRHNRSLRDFDLQKRLFKYPLSYMIYSAAFDALPDDVRDHIYRRLYEILSSRRPSPEYAYLSRDDRRNIIEILRDTKTTLPAYWR